MYSVIDTYIANGIKTSILKFRLPLNHFGASTSSIPVVIKVINTYHPNVSAKTFDIELDIRANLENLIVYLQGGPGFPTSIPTSPNDPSFLKPLLDRNYTVILLDQRGTGLSYPIDTTRLISKGNLKDQFEFIKNFRADSIVYDCEIIRKKLIKDSKWSLLGQSYGGFLAITYASFYPDSLKKIFLTGGLPPLTIKKVDEVYEATSCRTKERNIAYYKKFPEDVEKVNTIVKYLKENKVTLPNGGILSVERFRGLGLVFGGSGSSLNLHNIITTMYEELVECADNILFSYSTKLTLMNYLGFETNILYFLFQEAIYLNGKGMRSDWAADRVNSVNIDDPDMFFFTGEIVTKSMLESYSQLKPLYELANYIHQYDDWSIIYDIDKLKEITWEKLPIVASVYLDDQYVDYELGRRNLSIFEYKPVVTNQLFHNGLRAAPAQVLDQLHRLVEYGEYM